jgi:hypothetical protein
MKTVLTIFIVWLTVLISLAHAKELPKPIVGTYEMKPSKDDNRYGILNVSKINQDKISFTLYCVLGERTHNQGDVEGVAIIRKDHAYYKEGECEIVLILKGKEIKVEETNPTACIGYGNRVYCSGCYKFKSK